MTSSSFAASLKRLTDVVADRTFGGGVKPDTVVPVRLGDLIALLRDHASLDDQARLTHSSHLKQLREACDNMQNALHNTYVTSTPQITAMEQLNHMAERLSRFK